MTPAQEAAEKERELRMTEAEARALDQLVDHPGWLALKRALEAASRAAYAGAAKAATPHEMAVYVGRGTAYTLIVNWPETRLSGLLQRLGEDDAQMR
jgi:hypothetical protein